MKKTERENNYKTKQTRLKYRKRRNAQEPPPPHPPTPTVLTETRPTDRSLTKTRRPPFVYVGVICRRYLHSLQSRFLFTFLLSYFFVIIVTMVNTAFRVASFSMVSLLYFFLPLPVSQSLYLSTKTTYFSLTLALTHSAFAPMPSPPLPSLLSSSFAVFFHAFLFFCDFLPTSLLFLSLPPSSTEILSLLLSFLPLPSSGLLLPYFNPVY